CPDAGFNYANANYILLAEIVARLAECPFTDAVSQKVLIPAGLDCSAFDMSRLTVVGARWLLNDWCCTPTVSSMPGPGGMYLSLRQLQRWQAALHDGTFEEAVLAQLNTAGRLPDGALGKYGGGQFVLRRGEQEFYCHLGKDGPVSTYLLRTSHPDMAMIALANGDCSNISQICWDIFPRVYL
ncbi:MAG: serine hydrolase domain-containing protein, partial [Hyphomicrobiales bacterium]